MLRLHILTTHTFNLLYELQTFFNNLYIYYLKSSLGDIKNHQFLHMQAIILLVILSKINSYHYFMNKPQYMFDLTLMSSN